MLRPLALIIFLMSCDNNHRYQPSLRVNEGNLVPPTGTTPIKTQERPPVVNLELLKRGQTLYNTHCIVCHDHQGSGQGIITKKGYPVLPPFSSKGEAFTYKVITLGHEKMPSFQRRINEKDRWATAAYVEALILSRNFPVKNLDPHDREKLP